MTDLGASIRLLEKIKPSEFYNLAAQSFVAVSFDQPITTANITVLEGFTVSYIQAELEKNGHVVVGLKAI